MELQSVLGYLHDVSAVLAGPLALLAYLKGRKIHVEINSRMTEIIRIKDELRAAAVEAAQAQTRLEERAVIAANDVERLATAVAAKLAGA